MAQFQYPSGLAIDSQDNLYVADTWNHRIRRITPTGKVTTIAGASSGDRDGIGNLAQFVYPTGIAINPQGYIYITDYHNHRIRRMTP